MTVFAAIRKAEVSGTIEPFVATSFKLLLKKENRAEIMSYSWKIGHSTQPKE
jgi:hypothetical protein